jgi:hypothetical protein
VKEVTVVGCDAVKTALRVVDCDTAVAKKLTSPPVSSGLFEDRKPNANSV